MQTVATVTLATCYDYVFARRQVTPDENFFIDTHPTWKNIVIAAGFSGQYFNLCTFSHYH